MREMYLQLLLALFSFFGALGTLLYAGLTYLYVYQSSADLTYTWSFYASIGLCPCFVVCFILCLKWVDNSKKKKQATMKRYRELR